MKYFILNVLFIDEVYSTIGATKGKIISLLQLYLNGLPIPKTVFYTGAINENTYENVSKVLGSEFLVKRLSIQRGEGVYKIKLETETLMERNYRAYLWSHPFEIYRYLRERLIYKRYLFHPEWLIARLLEKAGLFSNSKKDSQDKKASRIKHLDYRLNCKI